MLEIRLYNLPIHSMSYDQKVKEQRTVKYEVQLEKWHQIISIESMSSTTQPEGYLKQTYNIEVCQFIGTYCQRKMGLQAF